MGLPKTLGDFASGKLVRLTLSAVDGNANAIASIRPFEAMLNPKSFQHSQSITYDTEEAPGSTGSAVQFKKQPPGNASCELMLDGTGAVPVAVGRDPIDVDQQIDQLREIVYNFNGKTHEPGHVKLIWGSLILFVRLTSISINYLLFKPGGAPLRATVDLKFTEFLDYRQANAKAGKSSPDLTHSILVREGDTLPLLCKRIYGDPSYYLAVARHNALTSVRRLQPGTRLKFPPLV